MATALDLPFATAAQAVGESARVFCNRSATLGGMADPVAVIWTDIPHVTNIGSVQAQDRLVQCTAWLSDLGAYTPTRGDPVVSGADAMQIRDIDPYPATGQVLLTLESAWP